MLVMLAGRPSPMLAVMAPIMSAPAVPIKPLIKLAARPERLFIKLTGGRLKAAKFGSGAGGPAMFTGAEVASPGSRVAWFALPIGKMGGAVLLGSE